MTRLPGKSLRYALISVGIAVILFTIFTHFDITGRNEGLFLLHGRNTLFEVKDDLFLGDGDRLIYGIDYDSPKFLFARFFKRSKPPEPGTPHIDVHWNCKDGSGYVMNYFGDGRKIFTSFSRFEDSDGLETHGLFVGGGLPKNVMGSDLGKMDETGMAYFNGKRWEHLWCNVNEGLGSGKTMAPVTPAMWKFLGSRVLNSGKSLAIESSHEAIVDDVPLRIDRYAYFRPGEPYFLLTIRLKNVGNQPVSYYYCYGDDPWLGGFGSSKGNVGWTKDRLYQYVGWVDTSKYTWAGYFDNGNPAAGEGHNYTNSANFIEWIGDETPAVYFSNDPMEYPTESNQNEPLKSNARFIGIQWGPRRLAPGEVEIYCLAIGMAWNDPQTGFPVKPKLNINYNKVMEMLRNENRSPGF